MTTNIAWFAAQLKPNGFFAAKRNLRQQGFEAFMPMRETTIRHARTERRVLRPLFPGYIFIGFDPDTAQWRSINSTIGVSRLVMVAANAPQNVPDNFMSALMARCDEKHLLLPPESFTIGDTVKVIDGPFKGVVATVERLSDKDRVALLLNLMGRATWTEFAPNALEIASVA